MSVTVSDLLKLPSLKLLQKTPEPGKRFEPA